MPSELGNCADRRCLISDLRSLLARTSTHAADFLEALTERPIATTVNACMGAFRPAALLAETRWSAFEVAEDYPPLVKLYGPTASAPGRYSPAECIGIKKIRREGNPDIAHISTSYVERQNVTMRMSMRHFTRLTNAVSKKFDNHVHALSLYFVFYNFCRIHKTLRVSPAMAAGVTDRLWSLEDVLARIDADAPAPAPCGPYKKRAGGLAAHNEQISAPA